MTQIMAVWAFIQAHWADVANAIAYIISIASIVVKLTPSQKDDAILKKIVDFIGKYIALNPTPKPPSN